MYKAVIFDVDGTLLDSSEGIIDSVKYTIAKHGLRKLNPQELIEFAGFSPLKGAFMHFCNIDENLAQQCCETYREYYKKGAFYLSQPYDNIYKLLENLKEKNILLGVATYKREDNARDLMKHLEFDKYFDSICGADNENKLTKTDILKKCLKELSCENQPAVLIGDSCHDGRAANEAGIDFIGVTYGFGFKTKDEIKEFNPVLCAENINDIVEFFDNKNSFVVR